MLRIKFSDTVRQVLEKHGIKDEKLESALTDLFNGFERRLLSTDFVEEFTEQQEFLRNRRNQFRG
ncbi:hypothetical protein [Virgibacillus ndiopensis]|uniref:hypothetical protein n=1 Tax=Virgibacillus ndiopensis TaxID=2004408 RepID=UPI000C0877B7|nr:hypothetical protein [Virgibacillus ndiopensis]